MNKLIKVFIVEDDPMYARIVKKTIEKSDFTEANVFPKANAFLDHLHENPDIIILDYNLPDGNGVELLKRIKRYNNDIAVILLSAQQKANIVVEAYKYGADNYIVKDNNAFIELANTIRNISRTITYRKEAESLKSELINRSKYDQIHGESCEILRILRLIEKVEKSNMLVLVTGESGTGKEIVAKTIHYNSPRKDKRFVTVNMAAIPEQLIESELFGHEKGAFTGASVKRIGVFEEADGGTIFMDEIGDMDINSQTKLLRVLQENKITRVGSNKAISLDIRVIAATNQNLSEKVKEGKFREDLYYRLQGFLLELPPLRKRDNDVIILARHFLSQYSERNRKQVRNFSSDAVKSLLEHKWPGNVRELQSVVERAVLICDDGEITTNDLIFSN